MYSLILLYLFSSIIPTGWISDLAVRSSLAYLIFDYVGLSGELALIASTLLWILNLLLPAIVGLFSLRDINWLNAKTKIKEWS